MDITERKAEQVRGLSLRQWMDEKIDRRSLHSELQKREEYKIKVKTQGDEDELKGNQGCDSESRSST